MKTKLLSLTVGMAAVAAIAGEAAANDYGRTAPGIRVVGAQTGVPVPAPAPIPDMPSLWYVSLSAGYAAASHGDISTKGAPIGAYGSFGEYDGPANFGFAAGRRIWGNWRGELDFTFRPTQKITKPTTTPYTAQVMTQTGTQNFTAGGITVSAPVYDIATYSVNRAEEGRSGNQTGMLNLLYDIPTNSSFMPYIGGGLGLVTRQTKREYKDTGQCTSLQSGVVTNPFTGVTTSPVPGMCSQQVEGEGSKQSTGFGWAVSAMAGVGYQISRGVVFDVGYRYIWQDTPATLTTTAAVGPDSTIKFDGRGDHEVRATIRWFID